MAMYCALCGQPAHPDGEACARPWGDGEYFCPFDSAWLDTHRPEACLEPAGPSAPPELAPAPPEPVVVCVRVERERPRCPRCRGCLMGGWDDDDEGGRMQVIACMACGERFYRPDPAHSAAIAADRAAIAAEPRPRPGRPRKVMG
jgi:hypothetical protein